MRIIGYRCYECQQIQVFENIRLHHQPILLALHQHHECHIIFAYYRLFKFYVPSAVGPIVRDINFSSAV